MHRLAQLHGLKSATAGTAIIVTADARHPPRPLTEAQTAQAAAIIGERGLHAAGAAAGLSKKNARGHLKLMAAAASSGARGGGGAKGALEAMKAYHGPSKLYKKLARALSRQGKAEMAAAARRASKGSGGGPSRQSEPRTERTPDPGPPPTATAVAAASTFGGFEAHTTGFGSRMLERMGWKPGEGLGAERQGRADPVVATKRPQGLGLGAE